MCLILEHEIGLDIIVGNKLFSVLHKDLVD